MTIFFYKWLTRNLEIRNTPVRVLPNIWTLGQVRDTKFGTNVSNKILLNAAKCQGYSFYRFWVIQGKPTVGVKLPPPHTHTHTQIRVKDSVWFKRNTQIVATLSQSQFSWGIRVKPSFRFSEALLLLSMEL